MQTIAVTPKKPHYMEVSLDRHPRDPRRKKNWSSTAKIWHRPNPIVNLNTKNSFCPYLKNGRPHPEAAFIKPLYLLADGSPRLSLTCFDNPDSVQIGFAFTTHKTIKEIGWDLTEEDIRHDIASEIKVLSSWLEGNTYQVDLFDENHNNLFTVGGFHGKADADARMPDRFPPQWLRWCHATEELVKRATSSIGTRIEIQI